MKGVTTVLNPGAGKLIRIRDEINSLLFLVLFGSVGDSVRNSGQNSVVL